MRGIDQCTGGHMIGMGVLPIGSEQDSWPQKTKGRRQLGSRGKRRFKGSIRQPQIASPGEPEHGRGGIGLAATNFRRAKRRWLSAGQIENANSCLLGQQQENRTANTEFGIVGMRRNH